MEIKFKMWYNKYYKGSDAMFDVAIIGIRLADSVSDFIGNQLQNQKQIHCAVRSKRAFAQGRNIGKN